MGGGRGEKKTWRISSTASLYVLGGLRNIVAPGSGSGGGVNKDRRVWTLDL